MDEQAKVSLSLHEGKIEISGSETFVKQQLDRFQDIIDGKLSALAATLPSTEANAMPTSAREIVNDKSGVQQNPYPNVIALEEEEVRILKAIPGKSKAQKMVNAALLYLVGISLKGETTAPLAAIRTVCKHHSCLDSNNFSSAMKKAKEYLLLSGKGQKRTAKLTHPGEAKAKELASELNEQ